MFILLMFASLFTSATSVVTLADIPSLKAVYDWLSSNITHSELWFAFQDTWEFWHWIFNMDYGL